MSSFATRIPDVPESEGMKNALRRAKQLAELRWTPVKAFPVIASPGVPGADTSRIFFPAWRPRGGVNYSAARFEEKYVGCNISLDTYMTAMTQPDSVLYTRNLHGKHRLCAAYYGTVCSQFASYVFDLPFHIDCQQWPYLDGIEIIDPTPLENLRLCDILNERTRHTAVITGITRDADGRVLDITVTESTPPCAQSNTFLAQEFVNYWLKNGYEVLRYHKLDRVAYTPSPWVHIEGDPELAYPVPNAVLMPDYGDKANYLLGETVTLSVFDPAYTAVEIRCREEKKSLPVENGRVTLIPEKPGYYQAAAVSENGRSAPVEFCIVDAKAVLGKAEYSEKEPIHPIFSCADPEDELRGWVVKTDAYAKYWGYPISDEGVVPAEAALPEGKYLIIGLYRNRYGIYSTPPCFFAVKK